MASLRAATRHVLRVPVDELTIPVDELLRHFEHINTVSNSEVSVRQDLDIGIQIPLSASWTQPVFWPAPSIYDQPSIGRPSGLTGRYIPTSPSNLIGELLRHIEHINDKGLRAYDNLFIQTWHDLTCRGCFPTALCLLGILFICHTSGPSFTGSNG